MSFKRVGAGVLGVLVSLPAAAVVGRQVEQLHSRQREPRPIARQLQPLEVQGPSALAAAARAFLERHAGRWTFLTDPSTGHAGLVQGPGIPLIPGRGNDLGAERLQQLRLDEAAVKLDAVDALEPAIRAFIDEGRELLVPQTGELRLNPGLSATRDDGRLVSFYYDWWVGGLEVEGARVFVRVNSGNITQFGTELIGPIALDTAPSIGPAAALSRLLDYSGDAEVARPGGAPELLIQAEGDPAGTLVYRLVWRLAYTVFGQIEAWEGRVDAQTGEVVAFRDTTRYARAVGGVWPETPAEGQETRMPLADLDIINDGVLRLTDAGGYVAHPGGTVISGMTGRYFNVSCQDCNNPTQPIDAASVGSGWLDFGMGGNDQVGNGNSTRADRTAFYHLNRIRRLALKWLPNAGFIASIGFTARTNIADTCNASFGGSAVNFFRSGGGCNNTGEIADVIRHEWGHGLDLNTQPGDGGTGEGTADVVAFHMSHDPRIGPGFRTTGDPVRNLDKTVSPLGTMTLSRIDAGDCNVLQNDGLSPHCVGQVFGQSAWDLAQLLVAKHGHHTGWRASERIFFSSLPDAGTYDPSSTLAIYGAYVNADDDDGNLANGTPNGPEIFAAFSQHEIAQAAVGSSPACTRPAQPQLTIDPACPRFNLSWTAVPGADSYHVFRAELREDTAYIKIGELAGATTLFTDETVAPGVDYWYSVMAVDAAGCESTVEDPQPAQLPAQAILDIGAVRIDDAPLGNRSGGADPGETVDLAITLDNVGLADAVDPTGRLFVSTPGVTLLEDQAAWPSSIAAGQAADNVQTLRFRLSPSIACGTRLQFQFLPTDTGSGCSSRINYFEARVGKLVQGQYVCDATPPCFIEPTFAGAEAAVAGPSCGQTRVSWQPAASNCSNAVVTYNVYRGTEPGFIPAADNRVAQGLPGTVFDDDLLQPDQAYHYVVQPVDSRSGEAGSAVMRSVVAPASPDLEAPVFTGLGQVQSGVGCGETLLAWNAALETCSLPVSYEIYRSTDPGFTPGPANRIGSTLDTTFVDPALEPGADYTYVVQARDALGSQEANGIRLGASALSLDLLLSRTEFEADTAGWAVVAPNDAVAGSWAWGDPEATPYQPGDDATPDPGVRCWITGLGTEPTNGDVDDGSTTLLSSSYDLDGTVDPLIRYARWFTNDLGASPGEATDALRVEVSNDDGATWADLDTVGPGTPLAWVAVEHALSGVIAPSATMRLRFTAADLGQGSLVEAGIDDFEIVDRGQGCGGCPQPATGVASIAIGRSGDDVIVDWTQDPSTGGRYVVYKLTGPAFAEALRIGSTTSKTFVHAGAALTDEPFFYRVSAVDACGNESARDVFAGSGLDDHHQRQVVGDGRIAQEPVDLRQESLARRHGREAAQ